MILLTTALQSLFLTLPPSPHTVSDRVPQTECACVAMSGTSWGGAEAMPAMFVDPRAALPQRGTRLSVPEWTTPLLSAIVPGAGQFAQGQNRFAAYLAVEAFGWIRFIQHRAEGRRERRAYRALASGIARAAFVPDAPVGDFEYYERMRQFSESGRFDLSNEIGVQPETDERSYNGFLWRRARETYWDDPEVVPPETSIAFVRALLYYEEQAIRNELRWSWRNAQLEHDQFRRTIGRSNEAFRRSVEDLAVIMGNHLLSVVDANLTLRLRAAGARRGRELSLGASLPVGPAPGTHAGSRRND